MSTFPGDIPQVERVSHFILDSIDAGGLGLLAMMCLTLAAIVVTVIVVGRREQREYDRWYQAAVAASGRPLTEVDGPPALAEVRR